MPLSYVIGDIHGSLDKLRTLIEQCRQHAQGRAAKYVFLGDYIDRGAASAGVVDFLIAIESQTPRGVIALMGNHEAMALASIEGTVPASNWLRNGGMETLQSYGVSHAAELPRTHIDWLASLRLSHDDGRRFFVHAGIDPNKPLDAQDEFDMIWIREPFLSDRRDYGRLVVHGHTPLSGNQPELCNNRLNLDTGAVFGGPLTAAIFDDARTEPIGFLQAE